MKHDLEEWITEAIMSNTPVVVVEGYDDIQFYEKIILDLGKEINVEAVENIEGYGEGSDNVIKFIENLQPKFEERSDNIRYILGIIDKDVRDYREELPDPKYVGLLILKYYSQESHYITRENAIDLILKLTSVSSKCLNEKIETEIVKDLTENDFNDLYYFSLEALKNACETDYESVIKYSDSADKLFAENNKPRLLQQINLKKTDLDEFAKSKNIEFKDLKYIAKGKWILNVFARYLINKIPQIQEQCGVTEGITCNFCSIGNNAKCMWRMKYKFSHSHIPTLISNFLIDSEISYIKDRLRRLA